LPPTIRPCVGDGVTDGVIDKDDSVDRKGDGLTAGELVTEMESETDSVRDDDAPIDLEGVALTDAEIVVEIDGVLDGDAPTDSDADRESDRDFVGDCVMLADLDAMLLSEANATGDTLARALGARDSEADGVTDDPLEGERVTLGVLLDDLEILGVLDGVREALAVALGDEPFDELRLGDGSLLGVRLGVGVFDGVLVLLSDLDALAPFVGDRVAVPADISDVFCITNVSSTLPLSLTNMPVSLSPATSTMSEPASVKPFRPLLPNCTLAGCFIPSGDVST
jgi:hypothetical protein